MEFLWPKALLEGYPPVGVVDEELVSVGGTVESGVVVETGAVEPGVVVAAGAVVVWPVVLAVPEPAAGRPGSVTSM